MAKKKSLFDDRPVEISELTYIIKHDLAAINSQLADLQAQSKGAKKGGAAQTKDRLEEHRGNVVTLLQSNLASATTAFQDVLEVRTQNMKASRDRTEQFAYSSAGSSSAPGGMPGGGVNSGEWNRQSRFPRLLSLRSRSVCSPTKKSFVLALPLRRWALLLLLAQILPCISLRAAIEVQQLPLGRCLEAQMTATTQKPRRKREGIMDCLQTILPWEEMLLLAAAAAVVVVKEATIS